MSINYNETSATVIKYNNTELDKVIYNGVIVYQRITVNYYCENTVYKSVKVVSGNNVDLSSDNAASKSGWTFVGWRKDKTANGSIQSSITASTNDINLYAVYRQSITLSYNGNGNTGGSTAAQSDYRYYNNGNTTNPTFTIRANGFSKSGYSFVNWRLNSTSGTAYNPNNTITLTTNATLYAMWQEVFNGYLYNAGNEYTTFTGGWNDSGYSMHGSCPEGGTYSKTSSYIQVNPDTNGRHAKTIGTSKLINLAGYSKIIFTCQVPTGQTFPLTTTIPQPNISAYVFFGLDYTENGIFYGISDAKSMVQVRAEGYGKYKYDWSTPWKDYTYVRLLSVRLQ